MGGTTHAPLNLDEVRALVMAALEEDYAHNDRTSLALVQNDQRGIGEILAKGVGVLAGLPVAAEVFAAIDASVTWEVLTDDGAAVTPGEVVARVRGRLKPILSAERVALNFLQHLSGVATATRQMVNELEGTLCRLRDTRKTLPSLRSLEKYAVRMGGGANHRLHLADGILIKDNHLAALRARGLGIADALRMAREANPELTVEVEVTTVAEALDALEGGAGELLLDNMSLEEMREVVRLSAGRAVIEASGGITLQTARGVAQTGVDYIAVGALTHSAKALDISLEVQVI